MMYDNPYLGLLYYGASLLLFGICLLFNDMISEWLHRRHEERERIRNQPKPAPDDVTECKHEHLSVWSRPYETCGRWHQQRMCKRCLQIFVSSQLYFYEPLQGGQKSA